MVIHRITPNSNEGDFNTHRAFLVAANSNKEAVALVKKYLLEECDSEFEKEEIGDYTYDEHVYPFDAVGVEKPQIIDVI
jgi:hypothetical protein